MTETVSIPHGLGNTIVGGGAYANPDDWKWSDDFDAATLEWFHENFELVTEGAPFLGNPKEDWYQGVNFTTLIRRKSDGELFGYEYWEPVAKHGEPYYEANGEDYETFVFKKVKPFVVTGYEVVE